MQICVILALGMLCHVGYSLVGSRICRHHSEAFAYVWQCGSANQHDADLWHRNRTTQSHWLAKGVRVISTS